MKKHVAIFLIMISVMTCVYAGILDTIKSGVSSAVNKVTGKQDAYSMPEEDFKNACKVLDYTDLMKRVDENKDKAIYLEVGITQNVSSTDYLAYRTISLYGVIAGIDTDKPYYLVDALMKNPTLNTGSYFKIWGLYKGIKDVTTLQGHIKMPQIEVVYSYVY